MNYEPLHGSCGLQRMQLHRGQHEVHQLLRLLRQLYFHQAPIQQAFHERQDFLQVVRLRQHSHGSQIQEPRVELPKWRRNHERTLLSKTILQNEVVNFAILQTCVIIYLTIQRRK